MNLNAFLLSKSDAFLQCFVTLVPALVSKAWSNIIYSASKTKECFLKNNTIGNRRLF